MADIILKSLFWISTAGIAYAYFGYPIVLYLLNKNKKMNKNKFNISINFFPKVSIIIPFYNEEINLPAKIKNIKELIYPSEKLEIIFASDGSTDHSENIVNEHRSDNIQLYRLENRQGKAGALNLGVSKAQHEIIVFTDASILLEKDALYHIVQPFQNPNIGCISGEDHIHENNGEGAYGRYELWLRNLESRFSSIVGASGSFYAQRKELVKKFIPGMAPDFLSVLYTVEKGFQAITNPAAKGYMKSVKKTSHEFSRKVRTMVRGMAALSYKKSLLNFFKHPNFAFSLISHKVMRWFIPWLMILSLASNTFLIDINIFYQLLFYFQLVFYGLACISAFKGFYLHRTFPGKIALYFTLSNLAILVAWLKFWNGNTQEIWHPSSRN